MVVWFQFLLEIETSGWGFLDRTLMVWHISLEKLEFSYDNRLLLKPHSIKRKICQCNRKRVIGFKLRLFRASYTLFVTLPKKELRKMIRLPIMCLFDCLHLNTFSFSKFTFFDFKKNTCLQESFFL